MADITATLVKGFRDKTQAGMMESKKYLIKADGDMDAAVRLYREDHSKATIKEGRTSAEGVVEGFVREHNKLGVLIEINSETDFVARNEEFAALARDMARHAASNPEIDNVEALLDTVEHSSGSPARLRVQEVFAKMRENIIFKRFRAFQTTDGTVDAYVHMGGQIGVLVELSGHGDSIKELAHEVAMHIAAARPKFLGRNDVPENIITEEREIVRARTFADPKNENKPKDIIEKIIEGGVGTFYKEQVLLEQPYIREPKQNIAQLISGKAEIRRFIRYEVGEA